MGEKKKASLKDRYKAIKTQLDNAIQKREEYNALAFKCQGALELLEEMEEGND